MTTQFERKQRVTHKRYGDGRIIDVYFGQVLVYFDRIPWNIPHSIWVDPDDLTLLPDKSDAPTIPDGWTRASEPPENVPPSGTNYLRNVEVLLDHSTNIDHAYGFHLGKAEWHILVESPSVKQMRSLLFGGWPGQSRTAKEGEVIAWRELPNEEPAPRPFAIGDEVVVEGTIVAIDVDRFVVVYMNGDTESHDPANLKHAEEP